MEIYKETYIKRHLTKNAYKNIDKRIYIERQIREIIQRETYTEGYI